MKIILLQDEKKLGKKGQIVDVNDGYARNFILPKKIGVEANGANLNDLKLKKANDEKVEAEKLEAAKALKETLADKVIEVKIKAGGNGKTFGSVSGKEIVTACAAAYGIELDKKKIVLNESIKNFGNYDVNIKLHPQVTGVLKVKVTEE
ncbi:MAG: 50S ribosomal protein L9 [Lachnospiraceae bacterium]|nr:50S ribosomal protein L9 [Lachnospiraceae bacterium]